MAASETGTLPLGGPQSPKALLDIVLQATINGDIKTLQENQNAFLSVPENMVKCTDSNKNTLAHLAAQKDLLTLMYVVENYKVNINAQNAHGKTPLHETVRNNNRPSTEYLLTQGALDTIESKQNSTPFHTAASCGAVECMSALLKHAVAGKDPADLEAYMQAYKKRMDEADSRTKSTALHKCAYDGGLRVVSWLLDEEKHSKAKGRCPASVDALDKNNCTPLFVAVKMNRIDVAKMLLAKGANPGAEKGTKVEISQADAYGNQDEKKERGNKDLQGNNVLHHCAIRCLPEMLLLLLENPNVSLFDTNDEGQTPLHVAAKHQLPSNEAWQKLVKIMVKMGKQELLQAKDNNGNIAVKYIPKNPRETLDFFDLEKVEAMDREISKKVEVMEQKKEETKSLREQELMRARACVRAKREELLNERRLREHEQQDQIQQAGLCKDAILAEIEKKLLEEEEAKKKKKGGTEKKK